MFIHVCAHRKTFAHKKRAKLQFFFDIHKNLPDKSEKNLIFAKQI